MGEVRTADTGGVTQMIKIITNNDIEWNNYVSHPMQSWEWGEVRQAEGKTVIRFVESYTKLQAASYKPQAVYQMTLHPIPHTGYSIGYIPKSSWPSDEFLEYIKKYSQSHKILFVKFEPCASAPSLQAPMNEEVQSKILARSSQLIASSHPLFTPWTQVVDLTPSEEELLKHMHTKTRYNVRLAEKKGVVVKEMSDEVGYEIFEKLYFDTCRRQKYRGHTPAYHRNIWKKLGSKPQATSYKLQEIEKSTNSEVTFNTSIACSLQLAARILVAFYQDEPLAAFQVWHFKDTIYYTYGGSSESHRPLMAANLLMWEVMRLGKRLGASNLDMWGSLPPDFDEADPWAGFTRFKQGYGTQFVQSPGSYDLTTNAPLYHVYNLVQSIRTKLL